MVSAKPSLSFGVILYAHLSTHPHTLSLSLHLTLSHTRTYPHTQGPRRNPVNRSGARNADDDADRVARLEREMRTLKNTIYILVGVMVVAYAACLHRVEVKVSALYQQHQQMMMMMATNQHHPLPETITNTVDVIPNTIQDASFASSPPSPGTQQNPTIQQCRIQDEISSPPDYLPTFYEYLGIDISKEPFASWILFTANLSDATLALIYDNRHSDQRSAEKTHPKLCSSSSTDSGGQAPSCCPRLIGLHALEDHEAEVGRALMEAIKKRWVVLQVSTELGGNCDLAKCGGGGGGRFDGDGGGDAGQGDDTGALGSPDNLLLNFITTPQEQGQQHPLLNEHQHKCMTLISKVYGNLKNPTLARAYNRAFMGPLITAAVTPRGQGAGEDGGGGGTGGDRGRDGGGSGNECLAFRIPHSPAARKAWLDRVCESDE